MKNTTVKPSRRVSLPMLGGGALLGAAALITHGAASADADSPPRIAGPSQAIQKAQADSLAQGYRPSEYSGVMVRSVPSKQPKNAAAGTKQGWIYLKPGASRSSITRRGGGEPRVLRVERGRSAAGGTVIFLDPNSMPYATAERKPNGALVLRCGDDAHPHSASEHAAHHATHSAARHGATGKASATSPHSSDKSTAVR